MLNNRLFRVVECQLNYPSYSSWFLETFSQGGRIKNVRRSLGESIIFDRQVHWKMKNVNRQAPVVIHLQPSYEIATAEEDSAMPQSSTFEG